MARSCSKEGCKCEVEHTNTQAGYCNNKKGNPHWNEPYHTYSRPTCECGTDKIMKLYSSSFRVHSSWCPVTRWEGK